MEDELLFIKKSTLIAIADAVRTKAGSEDKIKTADLPAAIEALEFQYPPTVLLVDDEGHEVVATYLEEEVIFTATENDIREGAVAVTDKGVTQGTKFIPSYNTVEGAKMIPNGEEMEIMIATRDMYDYTKFQGISCIYNTSLANSVASEKVAINDKVYEVQSTREISTITKDSATKKIKFGIINNTGAPVIIRYITYKEIY